ncbi:Plasmodium exported protein (Pm-fam-a like), unknown function [Plasmodium malariae]|uniref:Uncharacterized protein n=1 Tax=Plasmodium malariae TaxID=5858 RepID=A0A1A8WSY3_PLAMA|nr:Plasmodium exported protein (Pm-fam-a like), unknown function [Plasmodium malariae]
MEENCKILFFINICTFILLPWICNFNNVMGNFNKYIYKNHNSDRTLGVKTYRLLAKNIKEKHLNIVWVNEEISYNGTYKKSNKCNNKSVSKGKNKQIKKGSINNREGSEGNFNKYIYKNHNSDRTLGVKTYRLLAKNIKEKHLNIVWVNEEISYNGTYKKSNKCNNKSVSKGKNKQIKKGSINNREGSEVSRRREPSLYTKRNPYAKEKMVNKIFYKNYVRRAVNSDFKFLKRSLRIKNDGQHVVYPSNCSINYILVCNFSRDFLSN